MTQPDPPDIEARISAFRGQLAELKTELKKEYLGSLEVLEQLLYALLADGHALLEGAPGLGKTTLVKAIAASLKLSFSRIQFTPDLMPADIVGARILEESAAGGHSFRFERGPLFANIVLADEINRATPRTQSAMLEAMQEGQVTVFGDTLVLDDPFMVIATQNPIEMEGTYPLPEAQLDRFLCRIEIPYPSERELVQILEATTSTREHVMRPVLDAAGLLEMRAMVREVPTSSDILKQAARCVCLTDPRNPRAPERVRQLVRFGSSPRGGQAMILLAKARALMNGRPWVTSEDLVAVAAPALRHRLVLSYEGEASDVRPDQLIEDVLGAMQTGS